MYRALRCLVLLTAVSFCGAPAHAQMQSDRPGPKSIRVIFSGFTDDASKECGLDVARLKGAIQSVVDAGGLTVAYYLKADADIQLELQTVRQLDMCATMLQLGLSAEGTVTLPFKTSILVGTKVLIQVRSGVSINPSATPALHAERVERRCKELATLMIVQEW